MRPAVQDKLGSGYANIFTGVKYLMSHKLATTVLFSTVLLRFLPMNNSKFISPEHNIGI